MRLKSLTVIAAGAALLVAGAGPAVGKSRRHHTSAAASIDGNTGTGKGVVIQLLDDLKVVFDNVTGTGNTTTVRTELAPGVRLSPCGTPIPSYLTPPAGADHFSIFRIETTATFTDTAAVNILNPDTGAHLFKAVCPPPKDAGWEDVTVLPVPGDPRGRVPGFSEFTLVTDSRTIQSVINAKLGALIGLLAPGSKAAQFVDPTTLATLRSMVNGVAAAIAAGDKTTAIVDLQNFNQFVTANSGTTIPNSGSSPGGNIAGALLSKASTLIFELSL